MNDCDDDLAAAALAARQKPLRMRPIPKSPGVPVWAWVMLALFVLWVIGNLHENGEQIIMAGEKITSSTLLAEYLQNEVGADANFKGRVLDVSGEVQEVRRDVINQAYVILSAQGRSFRHVQCFFSSENDSAIAGLRKGDAVEIRGVCNGLFGNVAVNKCKLIGSPRP